MGMVIVMFVIDSPLKLVRGMDGYGNSNVYTVGPVFIVRLNYCVRRFAEAFANLIVAIDLQITITIDCMTFFLRI